jgi:hypothetical protein
MSRYPILRDKKILADASVNKPGQVVVEWISASDHRGCQVLMARVSACDAGLVAEALRELADRLEAKQAALNGDYTEVV